MNRAVYMAGIGYIALCGAVIIRHSHRGIHDRAISIEAVLNGPRSGVQGPSAVIPYDPPPPLRASDPRSNSGNAWFDRVKPFCNSVEVEVHLQRDPPPSGSTGAGYGAACYALAGRIATARELIDALPASERANAAGIVFEIGHPVADAGDDASAGPLMGLVVEYRPDDYMALYHAGVAEFGIGKTDLARAHLEKFMALYSAEDGWRSNARATIAKMSVSAGQ